MNIFSLFLKSLYSPETISRTRFLGIGKTILFVFFLAFLSILPTSIYTSYEIKEMVHFSQETLETKVPSFTIADGVLNSSLKEPYFFEKHGLSFILDSTGALDKEDLSISGNSIALLQHEAVLIAGGEMNPFSYTLLGDQSITNSDLLEWIDNVESFFPIVLPVLFIAVYVFSTGIKFIEITILALFGLVPKNITGRNLPYRHLWRMTAYSVTLPTLFFTIMSFLQTSVPYSFILNWFVSSLILILAIKAVPLPKTKEKNAL